MTSRSQLISGSHYHPPSALAPQRRAAAGSWTVRRRYWVLLVLAIGITLATVGAVHIKATMLGGTYARGGVSGDAIARVPRRGLQDHRRQHGIPFAREVMQSVATAETLSTNGSLPLLDSRRKQQAAQWLRKHLRRQPPSVVMHQGLDVEQDGASDPTEALAVAKRTPQPIPFTVSPTPRLQTPLAPRSVQPPPAVVSRPPHIVHDAVVDAAVQAIQNGARPQDVFRRGRRQGYRRNVNFVVPTPPETEEVVPPAARTLPPVPPTAYTPADADAWTSLPRMAIISLNYRDMASAGGAKASWMHPMSYANKVAYCKKWGYDLIIEDNTLVDPQRDPAWGKIPILRKWLPKYQWIMWVDMDAFFMRFDLPATDLISDAHDMVIAKDWHGINFGIFLMRNNEWSLRLLDLMWYTPPRWWKPWEEQSAFTSLLNPLKTGVVAAAVLERRVLIRGQREMNSYGAEFAYGNQAAQYRDGDRMVHFPNCKAIHSCRSTIVKFYRLMCARNGLPTSLPQPNETPAKVLPLNRSSSGASHG